jgi:hypothetical protein
VTAPWRARHYSACPESSHHGAIAAGHPAPLDPAPWAYHSPWRTARRLSTSKHGAPGHDRTQQLPPDNRDRPNLPLPEPSPHWRPVAAAPPCRDAAGSPGRYPPEPPQAPYK